MPMDIERLCRKKEDAPLVRLIFYFDVRTWMGHRALQTSSSGSQKQEKPCKLHMQLCRLAIPCELSR